MTNIVKKRRKKPLPKYTYLGCPLTKNLSPWCYSLCAPVEGLGDCGRLAPHALKSRIREGIRRYKERNGIHP
ncbi:MAG: hypothetical protein ABIJ96_06260 [Elusimicrobiota bacterium]